MEFSFSLTHVHVYTQFTCHARRKQQDQAQISHFSNQQTREVLAVLPWQSKLILSYPQEHKGTHCIIKNNSPIKSVIMTDSVTIFTVVASIHIEICLPRISFIHHNIIQSKITKFLTAHDFTYCNFIHHWFYTALVFCTLSSQHVSHSYALLLKQYFYILVSFFKRKCKYTDCVINASLFCFGKQVFIHWQIPS